MTKDQLTQGNILDGKLDAIKRIREFIKATPSIRDALTEYMGEYVLVIGQELEAYLDIIGQDIYEKFQKL